jgi:hypothetical protein
MSESQVLVTSLAQDPDGNTNIGGWDSLLGIAQQIRLLAPSTISQVRVQLGKYVESVGPGGNLSMMIYTCSGTFRSIDSKPTGDPIATSTNTISVDDVSNGYPGQVYDFTFNDIELAAGIYYVSIEISEQSGDGYIMTVECGNWQEWQVPNLGPVAFFNSGNGWMSMHEWD